MDECQAIVTEGEFNANWVRVETYHELGTRIIQDLDKVDGVDNFLNEVAKDINRSLRTVYDAYRFAKKYPDLQLLPVGKNVTWRKVVYELLPENPPEKTEPKKKTATCPNCNFHFEI